MSPILDKGNVRCIGPTSNAEAPSPGGESESPQSFDFATAISNQSPPYSGVRCFPVKDLLSALFPPPSPGRRELCVGW